MMQKLFFTVVLCSCFIVAIAQEVLSLEDAVAFAKENSISLKTAELNVQDAVLLEKRSRSARMPNLSGSGSYRLQFGRTVDPTTNQFNQETIGFNSFGLNADVSLFNGGAIHHAIKQAEINTKIARADADFQFNFIALNITNIYLLILNAEEQLVNAEHRLTLSKEQLTRTDKLIEVGTLPANDRLDILAQIARNEQQIVVAKNSVEINYLNLKQLLDMEPNKEFKIERPDIIIPTDATPDALGLNQVYTSALGTQPQILANDLREQSAGIGVDLAKANFYPSLVLFGGLSSSWSSRAKVANFSNAFTDFGDPMNILVNDLPVSVQFEQEMGVTLDKISYFDQLDQNFGQNIGIQLNVPIYSQGRNKIDLERARLNILNTKLNSDQTKQDLKTDIQTAIANARAAKQTLAATQKTFEANSKAYENAQRRFDLGAINTFELTTAKNNLDTSEVDLVVSKYEYVFRLKIIDYYMGRPIKLD